MSVPDSEFERKMQKIAAEIAPHLIPRRRDDTPLKAFKLEPDEPESVGMSGMAEVLRIHSPMGRDENGQYCKGCNHRYGYAAERTLHQRACDHIAAMLTAAGFGPVKEAQDDAWKRGYDACKTGQQRHSPYRAAAVRGEGA